MNAAFPHHEAHAATIDHNMLWLDRNGRVSSALPILADHRPDGRPQQHDCRLFTDGVSFPHNSSNTGATYQVFTGELSWADSEPYMTGNFTNYAGGNNTGVFSFSAHIA